MRIVPPRRASHWRVQSYDHPAEAVFPLLCPVREVEYVAGWDPELVVTESGIAELDCAFVTNDGRDRSYWVVTRYEPAAGRIAMVRVTPGLTVCRLDLAVEPRGARGSDLSIRYTLTSLGPEGDARVDAFDGAAWDEFMAVWEREMREHLERRPYSSPMSATPSSSKPR